MTPEQNRLVQASFAAVVPQGDTVASLFYGRLFEMDPDLRPLFRGDMTDQGRKLMTMLAVAVNGLDRLPDLVPLVARLGARHATYGVKDEDYDTVADALLWTLEKGLDPTSHPRSGTPGLPFTACWRPR
jgi:hemoglobin-like flavoprotein